MTTQIRVTTMSDGDRTVAKAVVIDLNRLPSIIAGMGSSSRERGDKADREVGENLALARALRSLASKLEKQAAGKIKHREDCKEHAREIQSKEGLKRLAKIAAKIEGTYPLDEPQNPKFIEPDPACRRSCCRKEH